MGKHTIAAGLAGLLLVMGVSITASTLSEGSAPSAAVGTSSTYVERKCSSTCGLADEPAGQQVVQCGWAVDDLAPDVLTDGLVERCDYRVTGEACQEDEVCAVAAIRSTGQFPAPTDYATTP